ncbi:unnamed protein product, partial [marine sediment metagenome]
PFSSKLCKIELMLWKKFWAGLFFLFLLFPNTAFAKIGVGIGTGKIQVDEDLKPGIIYELPVLTVLNTGDEESDYEVSVAYHSKQPELSPSKDWFVFSPQKFHLKPGEAKNIEIKLNLPIRTQPGDYFAYLEGHPAKKSQSGSTSIGVAAAAKLYFTVVPANFLQGIYYKLVSFYKVYSPWPRRVVIALAVLLAIVAFKKFFNIKINLKRPEDKNPNDNKKDE